VAVGFLDDLLGSAVPKGGASSPLMTALMALLASGALSGRGSGGSGGLLGGLGPLLQQFQNKGLGGLVDSWIGTGPNRALSPEQLGSALDPDTIRSLQQQSGLSHGDLMEQLSQVLPGLVDKLTPQGRLPDEDELSRLSEQLK
jgi:uncharacterized protein YidB (DUF937 family)